MHNSLANTLNQLYDQDKAAGKSIYSLGAALGIETGYKAEGTINSAITDSKRGTVSGDVSKTVPVDKAKKDGNGNVIANTYVAITKIASKGKSSIPVYFDSSGTAYPITSYEGNAASATKAIHDGRNLNIAAYYMTLDKVTNGTIYTDPSTKESIIKNITSGIGSASLPVYFDANGCAHPITSLSVTVDKAIKDQRGNIIDTYYEPIKNVTSKGSATVPIYFDSNGIAAPITSYSGVAESSKNIITTSGNKVAGDNIIKNIVTIGQSIGIETGLTATGASSGKTQGVSTGSGLINTIIKIGESVGVETGLKPDGTPNGKTPGSSTTVNSGNVPSAYQPSVNPTKDTSGNTININNVLNPSTATPKPQGSPSYTVTITNSNGTTTTQTIQDIVVMTDSKGTVFCRFDLPANGLIWLDGPLGITSSTSISDVLRMQISLLVKDVSGSRSANMWINSEGVATVVRQSVANKHIGVYNDGEGKYTFMMVIR